MGNLPPRPPSVPLAGSPGGRGVFVMHEQGWRLTVQGGTGGRFGRSLETETARRVYCRQCLEPGQPLFGSSGPPSRNIKREAPDVSLVASTPRTGFGHQQVARRFHRASGSVSWRLRFQLPGRSRPLPCPAVLLASELTPRTDVKLGKLALSRQLDSPH